jgi:hypothetical protein
MESNHIEWRSKCFEVTEKARKVACLEAMVTDFEHIALELARQIAAEEERTGVKNPTHFAYSILAKATAMRRTNLLISAADLRGKLDMARRELEGREAELRALGPLVETRDTDRQVGKFDRRKRSGMSLV